MSGIGRYYWTRWPMVIAVMAVLIACSDIDSLMLRNRR